ncbi:hypothetical protein Tco_0945810 [Tanacetum coccineum]
MLYSAVYRILGVLQYSLWAKVIRALHDSEGGFDHNGCKFKGIWSRIVDSSNYLHSSSILPSDSIRFQVGCGSLTRFWKDIWLGNSPLYTRFNRLFRLDQDKNCRIVDRIVDGQWSWNWSCNTLGVCNTAYLNSLLLESSELDIYEATDKCVWSLAHDEAFSAAALRRRIDDHILPSLDIKTTWDKTLPRKVNIFMWRLKLDRLPHRLNLSSRVAMSKMTTLAEHIIVVGTENRPPMLEKSMYDSWASRIRLFIKGKKNGRMMLDSISNGPLVYPTIEENEQTRPKKYSELTEAQQLQDDCDVQETNIILHGLPPDVYELVNHQEAAKDIWILSADQWTCILLGIQAAIQVNTKLTDAPSDRNGASLSLIYPDPLALVANSQTLYNPSQSLQHSGSSMYPPPQQFTLVYAAPIHHQHHHTPINPQQQSFSLQPFISPLVTLQSQAEFPQLDSGLAVSTFQQGEDPINCINKAMAFLSAVASRNRRIATTSRGNYAAGQAKIVKCYNFLGERHMAKQCTQPKRPRSSAWFKEKLMLAEAQEAGQILDEEQLAFIADPELAKVQVAQQTTP